MMTRVDDRPGVRWITPLLATLLALGWAPGARTLAQTGTPLQQQLLAEDLTSLAKTARERGDASRGAIVFYRPDLLCTRCHSAGDDTARLGPDLAKAGKDATDRYLVESILLP